MADGPILTSFISFCEEDEWPYERIEGEDLLKIDFEGSTGVWVCAARAEEEAEQLAFYSYLPTLVPEDRRAAVAELACRINYHMVVGSFEMDPDDGEMRLRTSLDAEGSELTTSWIRQLVHANVLQMDVFAPAINAVIDGDPPDQAISAALASSEPELEAE